MANVPDVRALVMKRSLERCEAMVDLPRARTRCGKWPVEDHHMLTRSRGGLILDAVGEIYHHLALCPWHHREAHAPGGHDKGLMMHGAVVTSAGRVYYKGDDDYLRERYGYNRPLEVPMVREALLRAQSGETARGDL